MKGTILGFDASKSTGKIRGEDDQRYAFDKSEFNSDVEPVSGVKVDFDVEGSVAKDVYIVSRAVNKSTSAAKMQDIQAKAANIAGDISSNPDFIKTRDSALAGFLNSPVGISAGLVYLIAMFMPFFAINLGGMFGISVSFIETGIGKLAFVVAAAVIAMIFLQKPKFMRLVIISLLLLPFVSVIVEVSSLADDLGRRFDFGRVFGQFIENGMGAGLFVLPVAALVMLFSPMKKEGA